MREKKKFEKLRLTAILITVVHHHVTIHLCQIQILKGHVALR